MDQNTFPPNGPSRKLGSKPITLQDVATAAGVSVSTVSRVLDERLPPSRSKAAERVRQVANWITDATLWPRACAVAAQAPSACWCRA